MKSILPLGRAQVFWDETKDHAKRNLFLICRLNRVNERPIVIGPLVTAHPIDDRTAVYVPATERGPFFQSPIGIAALRIS